jgi:hypothetical protein
VEAPEETYTVTPGEIKEISLVIEDLEFNEFTVSATATE